MTAEKHQSNYRIVAQLERSGILTLRFPVT